MFMIVQDIGRFIYEKYLPMFYNDIYMCMQQNEYNTNFLNSLKIFNNKIYDK